MIRCGFILAMAAISSPACAAPIYLSCGVDSDAKYEAQINADEAHSSVSVLVASTGYAGSFAAAFSPTEVRFGDRAISYRIDRRTLEFFRTIRLLNETDRGKCVLKSAPKRAF